jgi:hypothetical protein
VNIPHDTVDSSGTKRVRKIDHGDTDALLKDRFHAWFAALFNIGRMVATWVSKMSGG